MKTRISLFGLILLVAVFALASMAAAATTNPSPASPGYETMVIPLMGTYTSTRTGAIKFTAPVGYSVKAASVNAREVSGTSPTLKIRGKNGSLVNYSGTIAAASAKTLTVVSGASLTDETLQAIDLVAGGTSPVFSDLTLTLFLKRK